MSTALTSIDEWLERGQSVRIPVSALNLPGFRKWYLSDAAPDHLRISFLGADLWIEHLCEDEPIVIPRRAATEAGYLDWVHSDEFPRRGRITRLGQEIYIDMSPEEIETHNKLKSESYRVVGNINLKEKRGQCYSDGVLLRIPRIVSTEPDAMFVTWRTLKSGRVRLVPRKDRYREYIQLTGVPDWILEVVSRSSWKFDTEDLVEAYHRAGVSEYWLVNALGEEIDFRILLHAKKGYVPAPAKAGWQRSQVFERWFRFTRRIADMDLWEYVLQARK